MRGLRLAGNLGFERVVLQSDNAGVIQLLQSPSPSRPYGQVCFIFTLLSKAWVVDFSLIRREANMTVDFMVKFDTPPSGSTSILNVTHRDLLDILQHDISSSSNGPIKVFQRFGFRLILIKKNREII
ncbi:hypothetical protein GQ457_13G008020 [Hibiscus cannabinus]